VYAISKAFGGIKAGPENGIWGYFLTFVIAYLRDLVLNHQYVAESFETNVPWDKAEALCWRVQEKIVQSCQSNGVSKRIYVSSWVT